MVARVLFLWLPLCVMAIAGAEQDFYGVMNVGAEWGGEEHIKIYEEEPVDTILYRPISEYDELFRRVGRVMGNDWRLMSAIAYHESRFRPEVISPAGAMGLMQVMPQVARKFGISYEQLYETETNVMIGNLVYRRIGEALKLPDDISERDRLSIYLASYNGGVGHVYDAQSLARANGENPYSWSVVARYLVLKSSPKYYNHEVVKCGRFSGSDETLAYVKNVMRHYELYRSQAPL